MTTSLAAISTPLLINGEERGGGAGTFPVYDPAQTGAVIGYAAAASADDALAAVAAAEAAWPAWAALTVSERTAIVLKALEGLETDNDARTDVLSRENGKTRFEAFIDLAVFTGRFHQAAEFSPELDVDEHIQGPPFNTTITKLSRGVVTIIYPFNWPLAILAAGNYMLPSLVLDPAPELGIVTEEQFGPALPIMPYDDEEQAIRLANATWSGAVLVGVDGRHRARDAGGPATAYRRHLLQQPQRDGR